MSDSAIKAKTGCDWERWVTALDYLGAETMSHGEIAELVKTRYRVADWWTSASSNIGPSGSTRSVSSSPISKIPERLEGPVIAQCFTGPVDRPPVTQ